MQKKKQRISLMERIRRALTPFRKKIKAYQLTREHIRWSEGWKRNATFKGKPLTRSMIRRVGSRARAIELDLIKA